jgi:hypothetical protein
MIIGFLSYMNSSPLGSRQASFEEAVTRTMYFLNLDDLKYFCLGDAQKQA